MNAVLTCASCGSHLPDNALFCPGCGQRMLQRQPAPAPAPPRAAPFAPPMSQRPLAQAQAQTPAPLPPAIPPDELRAAIAARGELGERMEDEVIDTFLDRIEKQMDVRIEQRLAGRMPMPFDRRAAKNRAANFTGRIAASLGIGIPLTAIAGGIADFPGILAVWVSIVGLNLYYTEVEAREERHKR